MAEVVQLHRPAQPGAAERCLGTTQSGQACRNRPESGRRYCRVHRAPVLAALAAPPGDEPMSQAPRLRIASILPLPGPVDELSEHRRRGPAEAPSSRETAPPPDALSALHAYAQRRMYGDYDEDEWGFDAEFTERIMWPLFRLVYRHYWRVDVVDVTHVPATGPGLLVANHAGVLPYDGAMIRMAIMEEHPHPRHVRLLVLRWLMGLPFLGSFLRQTGQTTACHADAERLLSQGELVGVFPEGDKGVGKPFRDRYKLQRFGRGGFVEIALRTQTPIVPVAVVGSEEIHPVLANAGPVAHLLGAPFFPITPTFPLLGPLGLIPLPSKWRIQFCEPIAVTPYGPDAWRDRALVLSLSERVRDTIQQAVYDQLAERRSAFF